MPQTGQERSCQLADSDLAVGKGPWAQDAEAGHSSEQIPKALLSCVINPGLFWKNNSRSLRFFLCESPVVLWQQQHVLKSDAGEERQALGFCFAGAA